MDAPEIIPSLPIPLPPGWTIQKNGRYLRIAGAFGHPLSTKTGLIPYHRFVLYEKLGRIEFAPCQWCGYTLPWKSCLAQPYLHVINADHYDGNTSNNSPDNLFPSCWWCNANRLWAQSFTVFWSQWTHWMASVPPFARPNLIQIAIDLKIVPENFDPSQMYQNYPSNITD